MATLRFSLKPVQPFRLDLTVWALRRRAKNEMDTWDGETYRRVLTLGDRPVLVKVRQKSSSLQIEADGKRMGSSDRIKITATMERILGLRTDLRGFYALATRHPKLKELVQRFKGLKPPRFPCIFEALMNGIACQQLSLEAGLSLLNRLSERAGLASVEDGRVFHALPRAEDLMRVRLSTLRSVGFSTHKATALQSLASAILRGELSPESLCQLSNEDAIEQLLKLRGIGRWTAEYVVLRGLGRYDLFPGDDVGARKKLAEWLGLQGPVDYGRVHRALEFAGPYRGLIYFHLLLDGLDRAGLLSSGSSKPPFA